MSEAGKALLAQESVFAVEATIDLANHLADLALSALFVMHHFLLPSKLMLDLELVD